MIALQFPHAKPNLDPGIHLQQNLGKVAVLEMHWPQSCERKGISTNAEEKISRSATPKWCRWILSWLSGVFCLEWTSAVIQLQDKFARRSLRMAHSWLTIVDGFAVSTLQSWMPKNYRYYLLHLTREDLRKICPYTSRSFASETIHAHHAYCNPIHDHLAHLPQPCHLRATIFGETIVFQKEEAVEMEWYTHQGLRHTHLSQMLFERKLLSKAFNLGSKWKIAMLPYHPHLVIFQRNIQT